MRASFGSRSFLNHLYFQPVKAKLVELGGIHDEIAVGQAGVCLQYLAEALLLREAANNVRSAHWFCGAVSPGIAQVVAPTTQLAVANRWRPAQASRAAIKALWKSPYTALSLSMFAMP